MNQPLNPLQETYFTRIYYLGFFLAILDLPRLISRYFIGELSYGGIMIAIMVVALAPFLCPRFQLTAKLNIGYVNLNIYGYLVVALTCLIIARGQSYLAKMILFGIIFLVILNQFIGKEYFSKEILGKYFDYTSTILFFFAGATLIDFLYCWWEPCGRIRPQPIGVIRFSEPWLGYESANLAFFLFFISLSCGFERDTTIRYASIALILSFIYDAHWAGGALLITAAYLCLRELYFQRVNVYLLALLILIGGSAFLTLLYYFNSVGLTIRLQESMSAVRTLYDGHNFYGLWDHPTAHGGLPTIIYQGGFLGILWIISLIMFLFTTISDIGQFILVCSIIFSYFWVYGYVNVLLLVFLHVSAIMPPVKIDLFKFLKLNNTLASTS